MLVDFFSSSVNFYTRSFVLYIYIFRIYLSRKNQLFRIAMCKKVSTIYLKTKRDRSATEIEPSRFSYPRLELKFLITGLADVYAFMQNLKVEKKKGTGYDMQKNAKHSIIRGIKANNLYLNSILPSSIDISLYIRMYMYTCNIYISSLRTFVLRILDNIDSPRREIIAKFEF